MPRALFAFVFAALLVSLRPSAVSIQSSTTGLIVGQVVDVHTGRGVAGAVVSLSGGPGGAPQMIGAMLPPPGIAPPLDRGAQRVLATADGRFVFRDLAPGVYNVAARKAGYIEGAYGRRMPGGASRSVVLADGERTGDIDITLWRFGAITGTVTDEAGEPVVGIEVRATRRTIVSGRRRFSQAGMGRTDDRGMYRLGMLMPGDYMVALVSTQVAVPAAMIEEVRRGMETRDPERTASIRALYEAGANTSMPGMPNAVQVGDMVHTVGRSYAPPPPSADGILFVYPTMFFPSSGTSNDAELVAVTSGEERAGVDFQLKPVPAAQVSGKVLSPDDSAERVVVRLLPTAYEDVSTELAAASTITSPDGSFSLPAVPVGTYMLHAQRVPRSTRPGTPTTIIHSGSGMMIMSASPAGPVEPQVPNEPALWARVPINVEGPLSGVEISLQTGGRLGGRVVFEGATARPRGDDLNRISVIPEMPEGGSTRIPPIRVDRFGQFTSPGLAGGRYLLRAIGAPPGWTFKGAMLDGRDVSDVPLDHGSSDITAIAITFTDRPAMLTGSVRAPQGAADTDATVLVFPSDSRMWTGYGASGRRFRAARASRNGAYTVAGLPPGSYAVIAVPDELTADWQDPARLETFARNAVRVRVAEGQSVTQDLTTER